MTTYLIKSNSKVAINVIVDGSTLTIPAKPNTLTIPIAKISKDLSALANNKIISISEVK